MAVLCCCSQAEAADGSSSKLMADRPGAQGPEWVLYEDMPEDGEIVSFNQAGDGDGAFEICQSEDGAVGTIAETTQGGLVCRTASGAEESFYVLRMPLAEGDAHDVPRRGLLANQEAVEEDEGETGGFAAKFHEKHGTGQAEMGELPPFMQFEFTDEEKIELGEAMAETDAMKRMTEECTGADRPDTCGPKPKQGVVGEVVGYEDGRGVNEEVSTVGYTFWCMGWMNTYNELQTELGADPRSVGR